MSDNAVTKNQVVEFMRGKRKEVYGANESIQGGIAKRRKMLGWVGIEVPSYRSLDEMTLDHEEYVTSREEAVNLIKETYPDYEITDEVTDHKQFKQLVIALTADRLHKAGKLVKPEKKDTESSEESEGDEE